MSVSTLTAGYPVHAVATFVRGENGFGVKWLDWTAQCGKTGSKVGGEFGLAGSARRMELCPACFPGRDHNACRPAAPVEIK